ncbi:phosphatase PAP2 family protein [Mucilaginibacter ginsenosidivorans]|uniref:Phosphatase PAP2 family protein n=1 Tax=Mucilaginibacter ginsenosidivorans TaxID=398053 RepID=A0A5B8V3X4_9SPHI|nr:phosphatase PAP2 family protein [Mucilaginibacter ginsenosidivorans]
MGDTIKKDLLTAPDTVKKLHSNPLSLVPPAAMITYGGLSFAVHPIRRIDYYIRGEVAKSSPNFHSKAESYFQFAPIVIVYGLNFAGVRGKNTFIDRTALLGLSSTILGITGLSTKHFTHRLRPNGSDYLSFPSGHTALAFMGAEFMAQEFDAKSPLYGVLAYTIATTTGVFRMYNRDHWFSDVVAGAGLGILSTKAAYLIYPAIRNWVTHGDKKADDKNTMITPMYQDGAFGLSFAKQF